MRLLLPFGLLLLTACQQMPTQPDYPTQIADDRRQVTAWIEPDSGQAATYLNELIDSEQLDALLAEAIAANPGLQQTLLTLKIRQTDRRRAAAARLPMATASLDANKQQDSDDSQSIDLSVSWEVDVWRKLDDNIRAAGKDVEQQQAVLQSARNTLGAEVIKTWLNLTAQQHAIEIEQRRLHSLSQNEQFILQRYSSGLGSLQDLDNARTATARSRASIEANRQALAQQQRGLNVLLGRLHHASHTVAGQYPEVIVPLAGLPTQTLQRRPDLMAAYSAIQAASLRTQVAYKDMLPSINIGASLTDIAGTAATALVAGPVWSLLAQLTAPIYRGGELTAAADAAELQTALQYQLYRETLLNAVNEVENALGLEYSLSLQQTHVTEALARARNTLAQYQQSYRSGLVDIIDLLNVQQQTFDLEAQLDNLIFTRLANRVDLGLALGLPVDNGVQG